ncbi:FHA domain-containing protein At4g14490-like [Cynara cardunculus var. scolymus]|uniref:FHA domain-containing protein At4g14490-like n=1 Tax=Cynara cardunculus var. scolymus TaxID=59895 RepID=UPI000D62DA28|nr:FHA domain-containing protein At4g14490-like [Cynara cardunculus var. scolymus]
MEESSTSTLKLMIEKGPREGETLQYPSGIVVKIGRVVRGNTIGIKDVGISSKHICIKFDNELCRWALSDLDSSNGTILNGQSLRPYVPAGLKDGDCIKIGELTSILVRIGVEATIRSERKPRRQGKSGAGAGAGAAAVVKSERSGLGLGLELDGNLGKNAVEAPVEKRNLRTRAKKAVDLKNEVESLSSKRILRSSRKEEKVSFVPTLNEIPEGLNLEETKATDLIVPVESKKTRERKRKLPVQLPQDPDSVVPIDGRKTRKGRKGLPVEPLENVQNSGLDDNLNKAEESVRVDAAEQPKSTQGAYEAKEAACDKYPVDPLENVENSGMERNLDTTNGSAQDLVAEKLVLMHEGCEGKEAAVDRSSPKGSSELAHQVHVDKGKEVAEELEYRQNGCEDLVKDIGSDSSQWLDLEKMTLGEFFDCLKGQLPKEIYEKSEKILSHLKENARKCHEFRLQRNEIR